MKNSHNPQRETYIDFLKKIMEINKKKFSKKKKKKQEVEILSLDELNK